MFGSANHRTYCAESGRIARPSLAVLYHVQRVSHDRQAHQCDSQYCDSESLEKRVISRSRTSQHLHSAAQRASSPHRVGSACETNTRDNFRRAGIPGPQDESPSQS